MVWDTANFPPRLGLDRTLVECVPGAKSVTVKLSGGPSRDTILRVWYSGRRVVKQVSGAHDTAVEIPFP